MRDDHKEIWFPALKELKEEYNISVGNKIDERSCRRVAILVTELFVKTFAMARGQITFVLMEPEIYRIAREKKLSCDPLDHEIRCPKIVDQILKTWGPDKATGFHTKITNIEEWLEPLWSEENGRKTVIRERRNGNLESQKARIGEDEKKGLELRQGI